MSVHRKLETIANAAIIVVSLLLGWVLVTKFVLGPSGQSKPERRVVALPIGKKVPLPDIDWKSNRRTVLIALQKGCHLCDASAGFHRRVVAKAREKGLALVAVLPDPPADARSYIEALGLEIPDVRQAEMSSLHVVSVPMVMLVGPDGAVEQAWRGRLPPQEEEEVLRVIG